jgi:hypothetical protein
MGWGCGRGPAVVGHEGGGDVRVQVGWWGGMGAAVGRRVVRHLRRGKIRRAQGRERTELYPPLQGVWDLTSFQPELPQAELDCTT